MCASMPSHVFWAYKGQTQFCIFMQPTLFSLSAEMNSVIKIFVMVLTTVMNPTNSHMLRLFKWLELFLASFVPSESGELIRKPSLDADEGEVSWQGLWEWVVARRQIYTLCWTFTGCKLHSGPAKTWIVKNWESWHVYPHWQYILMGEGGRE